MPDKKFLERLTSVRGVSGFEADVQAVLLEYVRHAAARIKTDALGSVICTLNTGRAPKILLECHCDEVGFIVRYISDDGLIYLQPAGTQCLDAAVGQRALIKTSGKEKVFGVIGTKPRHLLSQAELSQKVGITEIWADIGARNASEAMQKVSLGDPVSLVSEFCDFGRRVSAPALDNRAGMYAAAKAFTELSEEMLSCEVSLLSAVQEEIGMRGAEAAVSNINPDIVLVFDVCHTSDTPGIDKRLMGDIRLGKGPVIVRGPNTSPFVFSRLKNTAEGFGIPYQVQPSSGVTSTDAAFMQLCGGGTAVGIIAVPIRYMHTPNEVLEWSDLEGAAELACSFIRSCTSDMCIDGQYK